jgi:hypothetical protein
MHTQSLESVVKPSQIYCKLDPAGTNSGPGDEASPEGTHVDDSPWADIRRQSRNPVEVHGL